MSASMIYKKSAGIKYSEICLFSVVLLAFKQPTLVRCTEINPKNSLPIRHRIEEVSVSLSTECSEQSPKKQIMVLSDPKSLIGLQRIQFALNWVTRTEGTTKKPLLEVQVSFSSLNLGRVKGAYGDIHNHKGRKVREIENTGCIALSLIITGHAMVKPLFFAVDNVNRSNAKIEVELTNELIKKVLTKERESNSGENKSEDEGEIEQENSGNQLAANTDKAKSIPSDQYDTDSDSDDDSLIIIIDPELFSMTEANFCVLLLDWVLFEHECAVRGTELALEFEKQRSRLKHGLQSVLDYCIRAPNKGYLEHNYIKQTCIFRERLANRLKKGENQKVPLKYESERRDQLLTTIDRITSLLTGQTLLSRFFAAAMLSGQFDDLELHIPVYLSMLRRFVAATKREFAEYNRTKMVPKNNSDWKRAGHREFNFDILPSYNVVRWEPEADKERSQWIRRQNTSHKKLSSEEGEIIVETVHRYGTNFSQKDEENKEFGIYCHSEVSSGQEHLCASIEELLKQAEAKFVLQCNRQFFVEYNALGWQLGYRNQREMHMLINDDIEAGNELEFEKVQHNVRTLLLYMFALNLIDLLCPLAQSKDSNHSADKSRLLKFAAYFRNKSEKLKKKLLRAKLFERIMDGLILALNSIDFSLKITDDDANVPDADNSTNPIKRSDAMVNLTREEVLDEKRETKRNKKRKSKNRRKLTGQDKINKSNGSSQNCSNELSDENKSAETNKSNNSNGKDKSTSANLEAITNSNFAIATKNQSVDEIGNENKQDESIDINMKDERPARQDKNAQEFFEVMKKLRTELNLESMFLVQSKKAEFTITEAFECSKALDAFLLKKTKQKSRKNGRLKKKVHKNSVAASVELMVGAKKVLESCVVDIACSVEHEKDMLEQLNLIFSVVYQLIEAHFLNVSSAYNALTDVTIVDVQTAMKKNLISDSIQMVLNLLGRTLIVGSLDVIGAAECYIQRDARKKHAVAMPKLDTSCLFSALKRFDAAARELIIATNDQASEYIITVQFGRYLQILTAIVCVSPADYKDERINLWPTKWFIPSPDLNWKPNEFTYIVFEIAINRSDDTDRLLELFNFSQKNERRRLDRNRRRVDTIEDKLVTLIGVRSEILITRLNRRLAKDVVSLVLANPRSPSYLNESAEAAAKCLMAYIVALRFVLNVKINYPVLNKFAERGNKRFTMIKNASDDSQNSQQAKELQIVPQTDAKQSRIRWTEESLKRRLADLIATEAGILNAQKYFSKQWDLRSEMETFGFIEVTKVVGKELATTKGGVGMVEAILTLSIEMANNCIIALVDLLIPHPLGPFEFSGWALELKHPPLDVRQFFSNTCIIDTDDDEYNEDDPEKLTRPFLCVAFNRLVEMVGRSHKSLESLSRDINMKKFVKQLRRVFVSFLLNTRKYENEITEDDHSTITEADLENFRASYEKALLYTYGRAILINFLIHHSTASSMVQYKCNELIPFLPIKQKLWTYHYIELLKEFERRARAEISALNTFRVEHMRKPEVEFTLRSFEQVVDLYALVIPSASDDDASMLIKNDMIVLATKFTGHDLASVMKTLKSHFSMNNKGTANSTSDPANLYLFKWPETAAERNIRMMLVEENHLRAFRQYQNKFIIMIAEPADEFINLINLSIIRQWQYFAEGNPRQPKRSGHHENGDHNDDLNRNEKNCEPSKEDSEENNELLPLLDRSQEYVIRKCFFFGVGKVLAEQCLSDAVEQTSQSQAWWHNFAAILDEEFDRIELEVDEILRSKQKRKNGTTIEESIQVGEVIRLDKRLMELGLNGQKFISKGACEDALELLNRYSKK